MKKIAVFASGRGSNFLKICEGVNSGFIPAKVSLLVAGDSGIGAIDIAKEFDIPFKVISRSEYKSRDEFNKTLLDTLVRYNIDFIALAGWLSLIGPQILEKFSNRIVNIHPALLPFFGGKGMYGHRVHAAVWKSGMRISGATVHFVNENYDEGKIILQESVQLEWNDTPEQISQKVLKIEHRLYPKALKLLVEDRIRIIDSRVCLNSGD
ncbi:MAG: phosphoribosylglycinamide formyltransferase [Calditrichaceae bacterium]